jgi:hypothetical protein
LKADQTFVEGSTVIVQFTHQETNTGPLRSEAGVIPATGKQFTLSGAFVVRVEGEQIAEWYE